jgi:hypothetical protein
VRHNLRVLTGIPGRYLLGTLMRKIQRLACLGVSDWRYLLIASVELLAARVRISAVSAEKLLRELRAPLPVVPKHHGTPAKADVERLAWAIGVAVQYVPWRSDCLVRVLAADRWLRRHYLRANFYLGVAKDEEGALIAHAWLRYGDLTVTGGKYDQYSKLIEP